MGQTLTHGIYLPDEGERNCYDGLASNWSILDGAVGTVAEHTTQIAGKAPAVHTHVKSDITDLLNSNFIPSANNSYDLGSSSYQWNNLYAKNYYYNGVAWGLDKVNTWSDNQIIASSNDKSYCVKDTVYELGQTYSNGEHLGGLAIQDKNGSVVGLLDIVDRSYGHTEMRIRIQQKFDPSSNNRSTSGTILFNELTLGIGADKTNYISFKADLWGANCNLGTSTYKWKTLNGINPGALGIPSGVRQSISEYITNVNLSWDNQITAVRDGYIVVTINDAAGNSIYLFNNTKQYSNGSYGNGSQGTGRLTCMFPVNEGDVIYIFIKAAALSDVFSAYLYVMNGNVNALPSS